MSALVLAAFALLGNDAPATAPPDLSGRWVLNEEKSDDAREKMRAAGGGPGSGMGRPGGGGRAGGGGGGGGMGRPGGGMGGGGGRPPQGGASDDRRAAMRAVLEAAPELTITHTAREIAILEKDGRLRALHPDGEKYADSSGAEVKTRWEKDRLVVRTSQERGPTVTETWQRTGEPAQIVIELRFQPPNGGEVTVRRVYDRAAAD